MSKKLRSGGLCVGTKKWWLLPGSNQRPVDYDSIALPTELSSQPEVVKKNGSGSRKVNIISKLAFEVIFTFSTLLIRAPKGRKSYRNGEKTGQNTKQLFSSFNVLLSSKPVHHDWLCGPLNTA